MRVFYPDIWSYGKGLLLKKNPKEGIPNWLGQVGSLGERRGEEGLGPLRNRQII